MADFISGINAYNTIAKMRVPQPGGTSLSDDAASSTGASGGAGFSDLIRKVVQGSVSALRKNEAVSAAALVNQAPLHEVVTSVNEAEVALQTVIAVRDRVISAYQEILRMPI